MVNFPNLVSKQKQVKPKNPKSPWNDDLKRIPSEAKFWFTVWQSANKLLSTELHSIMCKTRNKFHLALRKRKKESREAKVVNSKKIILAWLYERDSSIQNEISDVPDKNHLARTKMTYMEDYMQVKRITTARKIETGT